MRLAVGTIFFDSKDELQRLIESCHQQVDKIFCIDGKLKHWNADHELSNDGSIEMLKQYDNTVLVNAPNLLEHEKRQIYLDLCSAYNITHLIVVDSDEYFHDCDWTKFRVELVQNKRQYIYNIKNYTYSPITETILPVDSPRLWVHPSKLEYKYGRHYQFGLKGHDEVITAKKTLYGIKLMHDPHLRSQEYMEEYERFCKWRIEYEKMQQLIETNKEKAMREYCVYAGN